jgi:hypothetical protein
MNLKEYRTFVERRFAEGGKHLECIETQVHKLALRNPVVWERTQWDGVSMPDGSIVSLRTTVTLAENRGDSSAACSLFTGGEWREVTRLEASGLATVRAFEGRTLAGMQERDLEQERLQAAFRQDTTRVRLNALRVVTIFHLPDKMKVGGEEAPLRV